jgi:hypothetical protein
MNKDDLIIKNVRIKFWEENQKIQDSIILKKELKNFKENFVIGDQFNLKQDNYGNFFDINNEPLSI